MEHFEKHAAITKTSSTADRMTMITILANQHDGAEIHVAACHCHGTTRTKAIGKYDGAGHNHQTTRNGNHGDKNNCNHDVHDSKDLVRAPGPVQ